MIMRINHYFKKNLDVPQEPPAEAWDYIQQHLDQKSSKTKPVVPIWIKTSGIAALFLLTIGTAYLMDWNFISPSDAKSNNQTQVQSTDPNLVKDNSNAQLENSEEETNSLTSTPLQSVANSSNEKLESAVRLKNNSSWSNVSTSELQISENSSISSHQNSTNTNLYDVNSTFQSKNSNNTQNNSNLHTSTDQSNSNSKDASIAEIRPDWNPDYLNSDKILEKIMDAPIQDETSKTLLASTKKSNDKPKNPIKKKVEFDRFHISGFISPMAMNTFVGNSMLADEMSQYKTENNVLLAYGMKGAYAVSPKVKIRAGVSVIGFEQITKDVPFSYEIDGSSALTSRGSDNNIKYNGSLRIDNLASLTSTDLTNNIGTGDVKQQSQYIEIPIEAEVSLFKTSSIGISATGGGSTWLLSKNKILAETNEFTQELGKADNLNKTSFSANAGLKFDMNLTDNIQLNVEPTFKYLINPVNDIKNFNPYTVGVNAGISISIK